MNVLAYYSTTVLLAAGANARDALLGSMGFGIINWLFALPAFYTIDVFGRRGLLLSTFPFMAIFHAVIAVAFLTTDASSDAQKTVVLIGMYLFAIAYSPGEGPVPFVSTSRIRCSAAC